LQTASSWWLIYSFISFQKHVDVYLDQGNLAFLGLVSKGDVFTQESIHPLVFGVWTLPKNIG
jgi:hypothetical protein